MHIGNKIKTEITNRRILITDFAKLINKSRSYIYSIFEKENIDTELLIQIANVLEIPVSSFFDEEILSVYQNKTSNVVVGRDNNGRISMADCQEKLNEALFEIRRLEEIIEGKEKLLEEKERLINVLMNK
ncbi:hypothetical protein EZS27_000841 [termite gut metagenome]|uniref:HTH cro/C1-type domain-containing protein n=1 Tax=termite gut metagenome TaxID=433724 RepID=A0A5J4T1X9_9ZZZZ